METQIVERFVAPEEEGFYLRVPFPVPEGVEKIRVSYTYRKNENIIDIGLCNPEGKVIGWAGSNRDELVVSEATASPGFTPAPLCAGQWQILLGAYHVAEKGCTVQYKIVFEKRNCGSGREIPIRTHAVPMGFSRQRSWRRSQAEWDSIIFF